MLRIFRLLAVLMLTGALLFAAPTGPATDSAETTVRALEHHYNHLQGLKAFFTQIYRQDANAPPRQESGTLYLKKPGKMRWEYSSPETKLFVSDGKNVYFYVPADRQVTRVKAKESADLRTPLRFLLGRMNLKREFRVSRATAAAPLDPGNTVLLLVPKHSGERFRELLLEVDQETRIRRLKIVDNDGSLTEFRLAGEIGDPPLANAMFQFHVPPGVEVVEEQPSE